MIRVNGKEVKITKFPNGEVLINSEDIKNSDFLINVVELKFESNEDLINLMFVKRHLDEKREESKLKILYMPYSRMDRTEGMTVFTLKYVSEFINSLGFKSVTVCEPHSDVTPALIKNVRVQYTTKALAEETMKILNFDDEKNDYLFYPDAGAEKRYSKQIDYSKVLSATKERDFKTGFIKKLTITGEVPTEPFRVIIVDDLCSRGGTFMLSAKQLIEAGATEVYLVVAHCEDTIHLGEILETDLIEKVITTESMLTKRHEKIITFEV